MLAKFHQPSVSRIPVPASASVTSSLHSCSAANSCAALRPRRFFLAPSFTGCVSVSKSKTFVLFASPAFAFVASEFEINLLSRFKVWHAARRRVFAPFTWQVIQSKSHSVYGSFSAVVCSPVSTASTCFFCLLCFFVAISPPFPAHHSTEFRTRRKEEGATLSGIAPPALSKKCSSLVFFSTPANPR